MVFHFHTREAYLPEYVDSNTAYVFRSEGVGVSFPNPLPTPTQLGLSFHFGCPDATTSVYKFTELNVFNLYRDDYTPDIALIKIPEDCYGGSPVPEGPFIEANADFILSSLVANGVALQLAPVNRSIVRKPNCVMSQKGATLLKPIHAPAQSSSVSRKLVDSNCENSIPLKKPLCGIQENATPVSREFCSVQGDYEKILIGGCALQQNAIPITTGGMCATENEAESLVVKMCAPRENAIPTNGGDVCSPSQDLWRLPSTESKILYPTTVDAYTPTLEFKPKLYTEDEETVLTKSTYVNSGAALLFRIKHQLNTGYSLREYQPSTFFTHIVFYPTQQDYTTFRLKEKRWQWLFGNPVSVIIRNVVNPLKPLTCNPRSSSVETRKRTCSIQENTIPLPPGETPFIDPDPEIPTDPPGGNQETIIVPTKEVYPVHNTLITTMADGTPLDLAGVSISFDADSHSWQWNADLVDSSQVNLVKPQSNGTPVIVHITVNGVKWHLLVERTPTTKTFNSETVSLSGRGVSALLDAPYVIPTSITTTTQLTNQQIAESFLPSSGWTLDWQIPVWIIPSGAYTHQNLTPLRALQQLVSSCGGMLLPVKDEQKIKVIKRYPVVPWQFANVNPDVQIPDDIIFTLREEPVSIHGANGVYVHGLENGGKQALCRITGSAGDRLTNTQLNNMMTDAIALRALGERALAGAYVQPTTKSIEVIMDGGTTIDLVEPGTFVEFVVGSLQDRAIVNGVSIQITSQNGVVVVAQDITLGEETNSQFSLFKKLVPIEPLQLVTLNTTTGKSSTVTTVEGTVLTVRGTGTLGAKYYIRNGVIESAAPNLPILNDIVV